MKLELGPILVTSRVSLNSKLGDQRHGISDPTNSESRTRGQGRSDPFSLKLGTRKLEVRKSVALFHDRLAHLKFENH